MVEIGLSRRSPPKASAVPVRFDRATRLTRKTAGRAARDAETNLDGTIPRPRIGAITTDQRQRFDERQRLRERFESTGYRTLRVTAERMIGATLDFVDLPPNEQALKAGRPVVRLVTLGAAGIVPDGFATGFL